MRRNPIKIEKIPVQPSKQALISSRQHILSRIIYNLLPM